MRRLFLLTAILAAVVAAPGGLASTRATIHVTKVVPITVTGAGFKAGERVKIVVRTPTIYRKTVTASRRGRFTAIFGRATGKCLSMRVLATGSKGSRATAYVPPSCRI
ncbi:MAG: hypothetical protein ACTHNB_04025 [Gaiellaceae bacterium]